MFSILLISPHRDLMPIAMVTFHKSMEISQLEHLAASTYKALVLPESCPCQDLAHLETFPIFLPTAVWRVLAGLELMVVVVVPTVAAVDSIRTTTVVDHTIVNREVNDMERMVDSVHHQDLAEADQWQAEVVDGEMEQLVVLPLDLVRLFKAEVSSPMRTLMLLLVVDLASSITEQRVYERFGII